MRGDAPLATDDAIAAGSPISGWAGGSLI